MMKLVIFIFMLSLIFSVDCKTKEVSYSILLSRREVEEFREALVQSKIGTLINANRELLRNFSGEKERYTDDVIDDVVTELSSRSLLRVPSALRAFIALREFLEGNSDSQILVELLENLKKQTITFEEMKKLVQILFEAAKKEREQNKTEKPKEKKRESSTKNPKSKVDEEKVFDELMTKMDRIVNYQLNNETEVNGNHAEVETQIPEDALDKEEVLSTDMPLIDTPQEKSSLLGVDMADIHHLNQDIDKLMKRYTNLFKERAFLVQGEMRPKELESLVWNESDQLGALKFKRPFYEDRLVPSQPQQNLKIGSDEDLVALLGLENIRRTKSIHVSAIEEQIYLNVPFEVGKISVVPRFDLRQPPKMSFSLSGTAAMTLDKRGSTFGKQTTLDTLSLDSLSEEKIKFHPSIDILARKKLTRKIFKILTDVGIEEFLKTVLGDAMKISNMIEPIYN